MSHSSSFVTAQVWGMFLQSVSYGMYLITCGFCFRVFLAPRPRQRRQSEPKWPMLTVFLLFLAQNTSSVIIHLHLTLHIMVTSSGLDEAAAAFSDVSSSAINMTKLTTTLIQTVIGSGVLTYRCWLVYNHSWLFICLPLALWIGAVSVMGVLIHFQTVFKIQEFLNTFQFRTYGTAFWAITTAANCVNTGLIVRRVWKIDHISNGHSFQTDTDQSTSLSDAKCAGMLIQSRIGLSKAMHGAIDSGILFTAMTIVIFVSFLTRSSVIYVATDLLVQIIGITFNLIIIRSLSHHCGAEDALSRSNLNAVPLQFVSSTISQPGSAIEFAYPKNFMPRRNKLPPSPSPQLDSSRYVKLVDVFFVPCAQQH
ncbi:hypothetical protein B0H10DRAFT_2021349 [Mycena sp. CBHHK59/15]|nr:hypothetical protein B0H10DRAFT_2021349 [Mycena sp. CBHHK59/15]